MAEPIEHSSMSSESEDRFASEKNTAPGNEHEDDAQEFEAIRTPRRQTAPSGLRPLQEVRSRSSARSHKSYDGYTVDRDDDEKDTSDPSNPERKFEVAFDGEKDPFNPRNRPIWRKWLVVIIVANSSLCVTCASSIYTVSCWRWAELREGEDLHLHN